MVQEKQKLERAQALELWGNINLQKRILAFNRLQKLSYISKLLNVDCNRAESLLDCPVKIPYFYDFSNLLCRLALLPDAVLARTALFIGASHYAREIAASGFSPAGRKLREHVGMDVVAYCSGEGRMLLANKRSSGDTVSIEELDTDILTAAGACYLRDLNIAAVYGKGGQARGLIEAWKSRIHNIRISSFTPSQHSGSCDWPLPLNFTCMDMEFKVSDDRLSQVFNQVPAGDGVIAGMVSKIMQKYEEETWKAFFM